MPKCPECSKNIVSLDVMMKEDVVGKYSLQGGLEVEETKVTYRIYSCPECQFELYDNPYDADNFLRFDDSYPRCPKCHSIIDYLVSRQTRITGFAVDVYDSGLIDRYGDTTDSWSCPLCSSRLFDTETEATEFFTKHRQTKEEHHG